MFFPVSAIREILENEVSIIPILEILEIETPIIPCILEARRQLDLIDLQRLDLREEARREFLIEDVLHRACDALLVVEEGVRAVVARHVRDRRCRRVHVHRVVLVPIGEVEIVERLRLVAILEGEAERQGQAVGRPRVEQAILARRHKLDRLCFFCVRQARRGHIELGQHTYGL